MKLPHPLRWYSRILRNPFTAPVERGVWVGMAIMNVWFSATSMAFDGGWLNFVWLVVSVAALVVCIRTMQQAIEANGRAAMHSMALMAKDYRDGRIPPVLARQIEAAARQMPPLTYTVEDDNTVHVTGGR